MKRKIIISVILVMSIATTSGAADTVKFKGISIPGSSEPLILNGKLTKPQMKGPCPAVVLLHGCSGIMKVYEVWAERLTKWGYVTLQVDSLGTRGLSTVCSNPYLLGPETRAQDAYAAKSYLSGLSFVDSNRIAMVGWSHGGWTVLRELNNIRDSPFRAAIAFYPYCDHELVNLNAPLLILIGEFDDWCPASFCSAQMPSGDSDHEVSLKIYPGAYHGFDF
ncbi:MAG: dienelactone hydrolase family protein, partial [Desulfobacteraceae bacterium]